MQPEKKNPPALLISDTSSKQFREFAAECMELARCSTSLEQRTMHLKMANHWHKTALHWENDLLRRQITLGKGSA
jgi:hypothetical protein